MTPGGPGPLACGEGSKRAARAPGQAALFDSVGRGDDAVGDPRRAQLSQFEFFELILVLKSEKQFPVEQFEATVIVSVNSTVPPSYPAHGSPAGYALQRGAPKL